MLLHLSAFVLNKECRDETKNDIVEGTYLFPTLAGKDNSLHLMRPKTLSTGMAVMLAGAVNVTGTLRKRKTAQLNSVRCPDMLSMQRM